MTNTQGVVVSHPKIDIEVYNRRDKGKAMASNRKTRDSPEAVALLNGDHDETLPAKYQVLGGQDKHLGRSRLVYAGATVVLMAAAFFLGRADTFDRLPTPPAAAIDVSTGGPALLTSAETAALDARFGKRSSTNAVLEPAPTYLTEEIDAIWPDLSPSNNPYFVAAYLMERYREAVLWSFFVELGDEDDSRSYSWKERQQLVHRLQGKVVQDKLQMENCAVGLPDCFGGIDFFDYQGSETDLLEPHHMFVWVPFVNHWCSDCLIQAIVASGPPYSNVPSASKPKHDCILGGSERLWEEIDYIWPECSDESNDLSKDEMARSLIARYSYTVISGHGGVKQLRMSAD